MDTIILFDFPVSEYCKRKLVNIDNYKENSFIFKYDFIKVRIGDVEKFLDGDEYLYILEKSENFSIEVVYENYNFRKIVEEKVEKSKNSKENVLVNFYKINPEKFLNIDKIEISDVYVDHIKLNKDYVHVIVKYNCNNFYPKYFISKIKVFETSFEIGENGVLEIKIYKHSILELNESVEGVIKLGDNKNKNNFEERLKSFLESKYL